MQKIPFLNVGKSTSCQRLTDMSCDLFKRAVDSGKGDMDFSAVISVIEEEVGVKVGVDD